MNLVNRVYTKHAWRLWTGPRPEPAAGLLGGGRYRKCDRSGQAAVPDATRRERGAGPSHPRRASPPARAPRALADPDAPRAATARRLDDAPDPAHRGCSRCTGVRSAQLPAHAAPGVLRLRGGLAPARALPGARS